MGCLRCGCLLLLLAFIVFCLLMLAGLQAPPPAATPRKHVEPISEWNQPAP